MTECVIVCGKSMDARAAALFVQNANRFSSNVRLSTENHEINGKSMMSIISLSILEGQEISISADGADEEEAVNVLAALLS